MKNETFRQAIVVVHGMGEQRPNDILYQFVEAALGDAELDKNINRTIVNRPDKVSDSYDSRRIQVVDEEIKGGKVVSRVVTEFYEYHWAHLMEGNKLVHVLPLIKSLFFRGFPRLRPPTTLGRLKPIWVVMLVVFLAGIAFAFWAGIQGLSFDEHSILSALGLSGIALFLAAQFYKILNWQILDIALTRYLADVARYLDASPENQSVRDEIRKGLVDLLDGLHKKERHRRIVVAAHSLGSIIAYDALTYLWARKNKLHRIKKPPRKFPELEELSAVGKKVSDIEEKTSRDDPDVKKLREDYRSRQRIAWCAKRESGNPWLVTDFLTFGSPLAHAPILMAKDVDDLVRKRQKKNAELPRCPPIENKGKQSNNIQYAWDNKKGYPILHYAAPFALVRWTNFFFSRDLFAGSLGEYFGYGIKDIELCDYRGSANVWFICHARYFKRNERNGKYVYLKELETDLELKPDDLLKGAPLKSKYDEITQSDPGDW